MRAGLGVDTAGFRLGEFSVSPCRRDLYRSGQDIGPLFRWTEAGGKTEVMNTLGLE